jgi:LemA protein
MVVNTYDDAERRPMGTVLIIVLVVVALIVLYGVLAYNGMVRSRNMVDEAWSGIDVQLKRRHDLIPNLVETVKGYAAHEKGVFEAVTNARAQAMQASGPAASGAAEGILGQALGRLFAVAEAYPQLRATENFQQLQAELTNTEDQISASRRIYNGNVQSYNTKIQTFPNSVIAGFGGFTKRDFFEIETPADREPVRVSFSDPPSVAATPDPAPTTPADPPPPPADPPPATS